MRALVLAGLLLAGCSAGTRSPEGAVRALTEAAADGDRAAVLKLLGPATRKKLEEAAQRAAVQSGRRAMGPGEALAVGWFPPKFRAVKVREVSRTGGDHALVEVTGAGGERERVDCVRADGAWRVELP
jgi:hypothetical protein